MPYDVTDRPPPAGSPDWERVVAVVVQGAKWQFKDWPHKVGMAGAWSGGKGVQAVGRWGGGKWVRSKAGQLPRAAQQ